jgi:NTE family protein
MEHKTALVLSAGGMFGAYQAGAYKAIAELAPPDIVVGASVGALNGWPIASRCTPDHLIERWLDPAAGDALQLFPNHGWWNGWFDPAPLRARAEEIWSRYEPRIPFGLVVVELPRLNARLVRHPHVIAEHLQATCSIPLFLPTVRIGKKRYLDGGLFEKLPIWAAIEMGATRIVAIDSLPNVGKWWLHLGINIAHAFKPRRHYPADLDLTVIAPSGTLGDANDAVFWKRENVERWVEMGMADASLALAGENACATRSLAAQAFSAAFTEPPPGGWRGFPG